MLATTKVLALCLSLCKILQRAKPCAIAINIVPLQVKLFCLIIFQIFETSFQSHQKSVVKTHFLAEPSNANMLDQVQ